MTRTLVLAFCVTALLLGCSSEQTTNDLPDSQLDSTAAENTPAASPAVDTVAFADTNQAEVAVVNDSLVVVMLEAARQHYLSAAAAASNGDSLRSVVQFEEAIALLDELSYVPDIENNRDFNDLSKAVVEDYERYIDKIDNLSPESSIFALREKLNQVTDQGDTVVVHTTPQLPVITGTTIPLDINAPVEQTIAFFQGRGRPYMTRWLRTSGKYFPLMRTILKEEGLPEEIVYLTMVESGVNPVARSWARAVGMWQFMKGTAKLYGLQTSFWVDERRDVEKATRAAARHLRDLYEEFGDWYLALAAYNSGAGRVYSAIRRTGSTDFWELRRHLPRQTRNYVPQYIGVTIIALNPELFGFTGIETERPLAFEYVIVDDCVDLEVLADCAGTDVSMLRDLNPELVQWSSPPGTKGYKLRVPPGSTTRFTTKYAVLPASAKRDWVVHTVRRGETLGGIASHYGVTASILRETNRMTAKTRLRVGSQIVVPVSKGSPRFAALAEEVQRSGAAPSRTPRDRQKIERAVAAGRTRSTSEPGKVRTVYIVKKSDTIGHIAEWFECRATDIRNWNDIPYGEPIRVGQTLSIWVPEIDLSRYKKIASMTFDEKEKLVASRKNGNGNEGSVSQYIVRAGDTLEDIAARNGVSVNQLMRWNKLQTSRIKVGQHLSILADARNLEVGKKTTPKKSAERLAAGGGVLKYVVKKGDTLWDIARAYEVSPADLREWNELGKGTIYAGQELMIRLNATSSAR